VTRVLIVGTGMTPFGRHPGAGIRRMATVAVDEALEDAGVAAQDVGRVFFGNAAAGIVTHQEMIRGQVALRQHPLAHVPLFNIENACASGGSAVTLAYEAIRAGVVSVAVAVGVEQLNHSDRSRPFNALRGSTDIEEIGEGKAGEVASNSVLMNYYAAVAQQYLDTSDASVEDFARVAIKNRQHASMNALAHLRMPQSLEEVLRARLIAKPLTLPMCSPLTDGAAALVLCSEEYGRRLDRPAVEVVASHLAACTGRPGSPVADAATAVYEQSGYGPGDFDLLELHDAAAPAELIQYAEVGLCEAGEGHELIRSGATELGGRMPVNVSGGLLSRGHPLGATGCAQLVELCTHLRGRAGARQVPNARLAMAINGGGWLDSSYAVTVATIVRQFPA
jgi:acetyl-CoA acetyltransferase